MFWAFALVVLVLPFVRGHYAESPSINAFRAFYCAGRTIDGGRDPYRVEPLRSCETAVSAQYITNGVVEPAPLPPFVLAGFAALAMLPYTSALGLFVALLLAATAIAVWSLRRITGYEVTFLTACLLWTACYRNITFAETPPLVIGILCASALLLERGKVRAAAVVAIVALVEPHVALPSLLALAVGYPRARVVLAMCAVVLALVSLSAVGLATSVEYVTKALPMHAASEVSANDQYSLTWLLHQMHVSDAAALVLGGASYVVMAVLGVVLAQTLAVRYGKPALLVLVPAAFALIGGSFIHDIQLPVALPAALVLLSVAPARLAPFLLVSIGTLAIAWFDEGRIPLALQIGILGIIAATAPLNALSLTPRYRVVLAVCVSYVVLFAAIHALPSASALSPLPPSPDVSGASDAIASDVWGRFVRSTPYGYASAQTVAEKGPPFVALLSLAVIASVVARKAHALARL